MEVMHFILQCSNVFCDADVAVYHEDGYMLVHVLYLSKEALVDRDLGGGILQQGQGPQGVIKAGKNTGNKHTHTNTSSITAFMLKGNCSFICIVLYYHSCALMITCYTLRLSQSAGTLLLK